MYFAAGEAPDEPCVDGTEHQFAPFGAFAGTRDVVQNPLDLGCAEVGVDDQTGLLADGVGETLVFQFVAIVRRAAVLPYDGIVDRFFGFGVPYDCSFALVGDTDSGQVQTVDIHHRDGLGNHRRLRRPYFMRIVFDPARLREDLTELLLGDGARCTFLVEDYGA